MTPDNEKTPEKSSYKDSLKRAINIAKTDLAIAKKAVYHLTELIAGLESILNDEMPAKAKYKPDKASRTPNGYASTEQTINAAINILTVHQKPMKVKALLEEYETLNLPVYGKDPYNSFMFRLRLGKTQGVLLNPQHGYWTVP